MAAFVSTAATATLLLLSFAPLASANRASPPLVAVVGDVACAASTPVTPTRCQHAAVARAIERKKVDSVWLPGDIQYPAGSLIDFRSSFAKSWRPLLPLIRPAPGNHEYGTPGAAGYFDFFGAQAGPARRGYYSFNLGRWHVVSLNSNCAIVGCGNDSAQVDWLRTDLARNERRCTAAIWHHPRFGSGSRHGGDPMTRALWKVLSRHRAELVLSGHEHNFEFFKRQDMDGNADPAQGMQQFVVGTGGANSYGFAAPQPNSLIRLTDTFGFLALRLRARSYSWNFIDIRGRSLAGARAHCR